MGVEPVEFTDNERQALRALVNAQTFSPEPVEDEGWDERTRKIVREEIASLAGLALRRTQDRQFSRSPERNLAMDVANEEAAQFWGEVLAEYGHGQPEESSEK